MKDKLIKALREANLYSHEATRGALFAYDFITDQVTKMPLNETIEWLCGEAEKRLKDKESYLVVTPEELRQAMHLPKNAFSNPPFEGMISPSEDTEPVKVASPKTIENADFDFRSHICDTDAFRRYIKMMMEGENENTEGQKEGRTS